MQEMKKVLWIAVSTALAAAFVSTCINAAIRLRSRPTAVEIEEQDAGNFTFPSITICPQTTVGVNGFADVDLTKPVFNRIVQNNVQLLEDGVEDPEETYDFLIPRVRTIFTVPTTPATIQRCTTFHPPQEASVGLQFTLDIGLLPTNETYDYMFIVHERGRLSTSATASLFNSDYSFVTPPENGVNVQYEIHEIVRGIVSKLSKPEKPCIAEEGPFNITDCLMEYVEARLGCRLPWNNIKQSRPSPRVCNGSQDFDRFKEVYMHLESVQEQELIKLTDCKERCHRQEFKILHKFSRAKGGPGPPSTGSGSSVATFYISKSSLVVQKEVLIYGWGNFLAEVGGFMGLFLGVSLHTLFQVTFDFADKFVKMQQPHGQARKAKLEQ